MKTLSESIIIDASPGKVFKHVDDIHCTGMHMSKGSMAMMGSKLNLEIISQNSTGLGATYRWYGKVMGLTMDFSEKVTKWVVNKERVWATIENPKLIIMSSYEMRFVIEPLGDKSKLTFDINYELPKHLFWKTIGLLLADWYSKWCLRNMCQDAKAALETTS